MVETTEPVRGPLPPDSGTPGSEMDPVRLLAGILVEEETLSSTLARIARLTSDVVPACDEATISVVEGDEVVLRFSTGETSQVMDDRQFAVRDGPCVDAMKERRVVRVGRLPEEARWADFTSLAIRNGVESTFSFPLEVGDEAIGILNLYSFAGPFKPEDEGTARAFAREAAVAIANARSIERARTLIEDLERALETRDLIGRAVGMLMARTNCDEVSAFDLLRSESQRRNEKLWRIARRVLEDGDLPQA